MDTRAVNPWTWQEPIGFSHGVQVPSTAATIYLSGQVASGDDGEPLHAHDMAAQTDRALDNIETILRQAGCSLSAVVRLNVYTVDVSAFHHDGGGVIKRRLDAAGAQYASTLLGVAALADPGFLIELEATAAY